MTDMTLAGLFFIRGNGDSYRTGVVVRQVHPEAYLVRFDNMKCGGSDMPTDGMELLTISGDLSAVGDDDFPMFRFFETRDQLQAWLDWLEAPSAAPRVLELVKKEKTH